MSSHLAKLIRRTSVFNFNNIKSQVRLSSSKALKAAVLSERPAEDKSKLHIKEIPTVKKLNKDEVRIQVHYCSLNAIDCNLFKDTTTKLPFTPGYEFSGHITEVGKNVGIEHISIGEEVAALSLENYGAFAEEIVINKNDVWRLPLGVDTKSAASYIYGHSTAMYAFSKLAPLKEKQSVAISIGPAGLGIAAIDVASHVYRAKVIAVCDTEDRGSFVRERGAFGAVTFKEGKLRKKILEMNDGKGVDVAYDAVGEPYMKEMGSSVRANGTIFYLSSMKLDSIPSPPLNTTMTILSLKELRKQNNSFYRKLVEETLDMVHQGITNPHFSAEFKLEDINEAIEFVENKKCTGKVVIKIMD